jgi:menaquinone-dependent protoporphyrinogen oxidase
MASDQLLQAVERPAGSGAEPSVLVAYASRFGSTRGVAERIAATLEQAGVRVVCRAIAELEDLGEHSAAVIGSAVFNQRWLPEAESLVRGNRTALAALPVWLFSVGTFGDRKRLVGPLMKREPKGIGEVEAAIRPRGYRVFAGVIDRRQWPFLSRILYHAFGGRLGDNRDWEDIELWARVIAAELAPRG